MAETSEHWKLQSDWLPSTQFLGIRVHNSCLQRTMFINYNEQIRERSSCWIWICRLFCELISSIWVVHSQNKLQSGPDKSEFLRPVVHLQGLCSGSQFWFSLEGNVFDAKSVNKVSKLSQGEVAGLSPKYFCPLSLSSISPFQTGLLCIYRGPSQFYTGIYLVFKILDWGKKKKKGGNCPWTWGSHFCTAKSCPHWHLLSC